MDAHLQGFLKYSGTHDVGNLIETKQGYLLTEYEALTYVQWGINHGYQYLHEMPEFETVKEELKL